MIVHSKNSDSVIQLNEGDDLEVSLDIRQPHMMKLAINPNGENGPYIINDVQYIALYASNRFLQTVPDKQ